MDKRIVVACDHAGYNLKVEVLKYLEEKGYEVTDLGTNSDESIDYPKYGHALATKIESGEFERGISICGSGNGINMVSNRHKGVRAALCWQKEIAELARSHNNANVCSLPGRFLSFQEARDIIDIFLATEFEGGRHERRINQIEL
jgi:ribose 5-phosphate isomerase B